MCWLSWISTSRAPQLYNPSYNELASWKWWWNHLEEEKRFLLKIYCYYYFFSQMYTLLLRPNSVCLCLCFLYGDLIFGGTCTSFWRYSVWILFSFFLLSWLREDDEEENGRVIWFLGILKGKIKAKLLRTFFYKLLLRKLDTLCWETSRNILILHTHC